MTFPQPCGSCLGSARSSRSSALQSSSEVGNQPASASRRVQLPDELFRVGEAQDERADPQRKARACVPGPSGEMVSRTSPLLDPLTSHVPFQPCAPHPHTGPTIWLTILIDSLGTVDENVQPPTPIFTSHGRRRRPRCVECRGPASIGVIRIRMKRLYENVEHLNDHASEAYGRTTVRLCPRTLILPSSRTPTSCSPTTPATSRRSPTTTWRCSRADSWRSWPAWTAAWTSSQMLGLAHGEAHIIRNAGGVVTDDVIRSLVLSQRLLGTREIILLHHTDCGMQRLTGDTLKDEIEDETGIRPGWSTESFKDPYQSVRQSIRRLRVSPFIQYKEHIRGFVYRVEDGHLEEAAP